MKFKSYIKQKWLLSIIAVTLMIVYYLNFIQLPPAVSVELQQNYKYKLILIPLDTRPPCQKMVVDAGKMAGVQIITPPSEIMDYYTKEGDTKKIQKWLMDNIDKSDGVIVSIDQLLHGGLLASRESGTKQDESQILLNFMRDLKTKAKDKPIYAFNVLPRITPPPTLESDSKKMIKISRLIDEISIFENEDDIKLLADLKEAKEIVPYLNTDGMFGATFCQKDGHADPFQCTQAYAQGAKRMGVEFLTYTEVTGLQTKAGRIHAVETTNGTFEARTVINCANVHAPELAKMVGEDIPVTSERHQALVTEPVAPLIDCMVMSFHRSYYVQQTPHGSFVMGIGPHEAPSYNFNSSWQFLEKNCAVMCEALPILRKLKVVRQWAGQYDLSPDCNPVIDEAAEAKGFYSVCGFSGHGFMVSPRIAILMANHLAGQEDSMDIKLFSKERYKTGKLLLEPAVV